MKQLLIGLAAIFAMAGAQAATINFNNNSGTYSGGGVTATVTTAGGNRFYNSTENAIGVGTTVFNGAIGSSGGLSFNETETMTVTFNQEVVLDTVWFRQWENKILNPLIFGYSGDEVHFDYSGGASGSGTITFSNSGLGDGTSVLLDPFGVDLSLTTFTLRPEQDGKDSGNVSNDTAVYLHSVDFSLPPPPEVPLPAAAWLFGSAMAGLIAVGRRRHARAA